MRMSCGGWTGGTNPSASPRRNSLAYRRYLRFLPGCSFGERDSSPPGNPNPQETVADNPTQLTPEATKEPCDISNGNCDAMGLSLVKKPPEMFDQAEEEDLRRCPSDRPSRREKEILRERGLSKWFQEQEFVNYSSSDDIHANEEITGRKDVDTDKTEPEVVSVSALVRQYTAMLNARNSSNSSASPIPLQTSRSCSNLPTRTKLSRLCNPSRNEDQPKDGRHGSLDSGDGDSSDSLLGPRYRSFSLPWPSDTSWRWSSDPNIMSGPVPLSSAAAIEVKPAQNISQHSSSLARLDSGTSDEGCPRDGSTGPTPPLSPVFRGLSSNHLSGLITPFKSLSPASSMGSHLGSVENIPLARSMSLGHVFDHWIRARSADSAVEVEDNSAVSPAVSLAAHPQVEDITESDNVAKGENDENVDVCAGVSGDGESGVCDVCVESKHTDDDWCNDECQIDGDVQVNVSNSEFTCEESDSSQVFCECENEKACEPSDEEVVELRRKESGGGSTERRERRCGEVDGDMLLRRARGCGGVIGSGVLREIVEEPCRKVLRTPSVVISDHSGDTISLTVALASSDFSIDKLDDKFQPPASVSPTPSSPSSPSLSVSDESSRKVSSCSSCSSVSTVDMTTPLTPMLSPGLDSLMEVPQRRISDCSTSSNMTVSEDEIEQILPRPPPPKKQSNWRKVRNIVQWTPFIQTYKKHKYPWVQLAGHQGNFRAGYKQGTILKKLCPAEEKALEAIMKDVLRPYVPLYMGVVEGTDSEKYLQLQDLLSDFELPCVMDIKMGVRTYLEDELAKAREKPKLRKDMFDKMVQIDPKAPTEAEHRAKAVTKPRYMVWRETISSTATQGFRIEGVRRGDGTSSKDFKTTRTREQVLAALNSFLQGYSHAAGRYVQQLKSIKVTLEASSFFNSHELIGSSLLFVHNETSATVRMIDFAKTIPLPENVHITHRSPWSEGTHEDGYLLGLDNLIDLFSTIEKNNASESSTKTEALNSSSQEQTNSSSSSTSNETNTNITPTENKSNDSNPDNNASTVSTTTTTTAKASPLSSTINNHTAVPVNASLT